MDRAYSDGNSILEKVVAIAGNYMSQKHQALDPKWTRLKDSDSSSDANKDGLRLELNGGKHPFEGGGRTQKAFVELLCDQSKTGLEGDEDGGFEDDKDTKEKEQKMRKRLAENEQKAGHSLQFVSYKAEGKDLEMDVLRLNWTTKYACEQNASVTPKSDHWGFFTWLIIM
jgi:autophagy-related protein 27